MPDPVAPQTPSTVTPVVAPAVAPVVAAPAIAPVVAADPAAPAVTPAPAVVVAAPESYDFSKVELPQGVTLDADLVTTMSPLLKELGLSQENASKLVKTHAEALAKADAAGEAKRDADFKQFMKDKQTENITALAKEWGAEKDAKLAIAMEFLGKHGSPELKQILDDTALGTNLHMAKLLYAAGLATREDRPPPVVQPQVGGKSIADSLYGGTTPNH